MGVKNNIAGKNRRKLIVSMNLTLDGFMSGPNGELDWHFENWTTEMAEFLGDQLLNADTILLGRITYEAMAAYWSLKAEDYSAPVEDRAFAEMMNRYVKIVFSGTLTILPWQNTIRMEGDLKDKVTKLKQQQGKNIMVYGSTQLVNALITLNLVDEFQLWMYPIVLSHGKPLFKDVKQYQNLKLLEAKTFRSGVVTLFYKYGV